MLRKPLALCAAATLTVAATAASAVLSGSFDGAPAGVAVPFTTISLPPVKVKSAVGPFKASFVSTNAWSPTLSELLNGETVITTQAQMKDVWTRLFATPYDPSQFDFANEFVVLMGGGSTPLATFAISCVERVDAEYDDFFLFGGTATDPFLAVTSTLTLPGILPDPLPPPVQLVSAVKVDRVHLDDVVFHRMVVPLP